MFKKVIIYILFLSSSAGAFEAKNLNNEKKAFSLPRLSYDYVSMKGFVDQKTMTIHHTKHHQSYINNLNKNLKNNEVTLEHILKNISQYPIAVRNNAGGHWNHSFFWAILTEKSDELKISKELLAQIEKDFGSLSNLQKEFQQSALSLFGSGWTWVLVNDKGQLQIANTPNQDNPLMDLSAAKGRPILALDVWEHAYYLDYQNERKNYVENFWKKVDWAQVSQNFVL